MIPNQWSIFNPFSANVALLYTLKTSETIRFSDVFGGYRSGTLVENGLRGVWTPSANYYMGGVGDEWYELEWGIWMGLAGMDEGGGYSICVGMGGTITCTAFYRIPSENCVE